MSNPLFVRTTERYINLALIQRVVELTSTVRFCAASIYRDIIRQYQKDPRTLFRV